MKTRYAVRDLLTGELIFTKDKSELPSILSKAAMDFFLAHSHDVLYATVQLNIDGSETWETPQGSDMIPLLAANHIEQTFKGMMEVTIL